MTQTQDIQQIVKEKYGEAARRVTQGGAASSCRGAVAARGRYWTDTYLFFTLRKPGITLATPRYDPNGKLDIVCRAGYWMRDEKRQPTRKFRHICWDGCMFPNAVMMDPATWNNILRAMIGVRDAHGWQE